MQAGECISLPRSRHGHYTISRHSCTYGATLFSTSHTHSNRKLNKPLCLHWGKRFRILLMIGKAVGKAPGLCSDWLPGGKPTTAYASTRVAWPRRLGFVN
jgi:hypothetical protein